MNDPDETAGKQERIRTEQLQHEAASKSSSGKPDDAPIQTGQREYPGELPAQSLAKPGHESEMALAPFYDAPEYRGSGKLDGRVALITGGDSGIGRAVAVLFAREGANVAIAYLSESDDAQQTQRAVEGEGRRCLLIRGDVKDRAFCDEAVTRTVEFFGKLDVLVNNAAFQQHADDVVDVTDERFDETMRTNVYGYFQMARAARPHLRSGGSIINTGSVVGLQGSGHLIDYATTKGAIHALTKSLAQSLLNDGIRVNAVAPGPVWTPLNPADRAADEIASFGRQTDFRRAAQPEEIAPAYVFLASPVCASYITGIVLPITGSVGAI